MTFGARKKLETYLRVSILRPCIFILGTLRIVKWFKGAGGVRGVWPYRFFSL